MKRDKTWGKALLKHLERTRQAWCFDEVGKIWTLETISLFLLTA